MPNLLTLAPGTRLGVYVVIAQIYEGGMGQVFRNVGQGIHVTRMGGDTCDTRR